MKKKKTITSYRSDIAAFDNEINDDQLYKYHTITFDEKGNTLREVIFAPNGKVIEEVINKYGENGKLVENILNHTDEGTSEKTTYTYNAQGNILEEVLYFGDEPFERTVTNYDEKGRKTEIIKYDEDEQPAERDIFEYNDDDKPVKQAHFNEEGEKEWEITLQYDENGVLTKEKHVYFEEDRSDTLSYTYNEKAEKIKTEVHDKTGRLVTVITNEMDENGNITSQVSQSSGRYPIQITKTFVYNENNQPVEVMQYDDMNKYLTGQEIFSYDEDGNVSEKEVFELRQSQGLMKNHYRLKFEYEFFD